MAVARAGIIGNRQWRSAVTNGAYPAGINGRTAAGRRYRDLVTEYSREITGEGGPLNPAEMALIRQAAALTVRGEALQADIVSGRAADDEAIVRLANTLARILKQLERRHRQSRTPRRPQRGKKRQPRRPNRQKRPNGASSNSTTN